METMLFVANNVKNVMKTRNHKFSILARYNKIISDNNKCAPDCPFMDCYYKEYNGKTYITHQYCSLFNDIKIVDNERCELCKKIKWILK